RMSAVTIAIEGVELACRGLEGTEELGRPSSIEVRALCRDSVVPDELCGKPAALVIETAHGSRILQLLVRRASVVGQTDARAPRQVRLLLASPSATLGLAVRSRIFRDMTIADVASAVLE